MMRSLVSGSMRFRLLVVAAAVATLLVGITQLHDMPTDVLPEYGPTTVEIQTEALGLSAEEVEQLVTVPMEQDLLNGVAFLDDIRSESVPGLSRILLIFEPGTDLFKARQVVAERLTQTAALPQVSKPPRMLQPLSSTNRVLMVGVSSKTVSPIQMSVLARWTIVPRLVGLPGVANVSIWGFQDRQLQVQVDPERLRDRHVSLLQVIDTTGNALWVSPLTFLEASTPGTGGFVDTANQRLGVYHVSPIHTAADLAKVRVEGTNSSKLRLGDVASVVEDHQPLIGDALSNGGPGLLLVVQKLPGASTTDVTRRVERTLAAMEPGLSGLQFDTSVYRPAGYIEHSIHNLGTALWIGLILMALALAALFLRLRTTLICLVVIPLSLVVAALVLYVLGTTMNAIVLAGLVAALAIVIDDAVVGVENVAHRLQEQRSDESGRSTAAVILDATLEMRGATAYATVVIALSILPLFFMKGLAGSFFPDVAGAYLLALLASMVVALIVTPALSLLLLSRPALGREPPLSLRLRRGYASALGSIVRRPRPLYIGAAVVAVAALAAAPVLGGPLLPRLKEEQLLIRWDGPPGTSLQEMNRITARAARELRSLPGVRDVGGHGGRAVTGDQVVGANSAELWVSIDRAADYDATVASVRNVVAGYPGLSKSIDTYSNERVHEVLTGQKKDVAVRIYGEDLGTLRNQANLVRQSITQIRGIANARVDLPAEEPTLQIEVNLDKAQAHGIKPGDVRRAAATLLSGIVVGSLFEQQKVFDVVVWGEPGIRNNLTSIRRLLIDTPDGGHVRLGGVADVRVAASPTVIRRQAVSRYLDVTADVSGRDRGSVVSDVRSHVEAMRFPLEYHAEVLAPSGQPINRLLTLAIAAAAGILLVLQAFFGSWRLAALSLLSLPLAVTGGVLATLAVGRTLSFGTVIGLAAVLGLAARQSMLLVGRLRRLEETDRRRGGTELVIRGSQDRLLPIVTTSLVTAMAMLPLVVLGSRPGYELVHPLAVVVLGGLVSSTVVTLFVVPALYSSFGFSPEREPVEEPEDLVSVLAPTPEVATGAAAAAAETHVVPDPSS